MVQCFIVKTEAMSKQKICQKLCELRPMQILSFQRVLTKLLEKFKDAVRSQLRCYSYQ